MELPFSDSANKGPDATAISAAHHFRTGRQSMCAAGTPLSSKGIQMEGEFFATGNAGTSAAEKSEVSG
jgi:hypothetical protein